MTAVPSDQVASQNWEIPLITFTAKRDPEKDQARTIARSHSNMYFAVIEVQKVLLLLVCCKDSPQVLGSGAPTNVLVRLMGAKHGDIKSFGW